VHVVISNLKRFLLGTYQGAVQPHRLQEYIDEFVYLSLEDWLEDERAALEGRSEYLDGEVFANDMKVIIHSANAGTYPDLAAYCGEPELLDGHRDVLPTPA